MFDLVTVGNAVQDVFLKIAEEEAEVHCNINKEECLICFNWADKIPVEELTFSIGGNAANVAVGVSRLGLKAAFAAILGDDKTGREILEELKKEGVDVSYVKIDKGSRSNYSVIINYKSERTILGYRYERKHGSYEIPESRWVYLTSMEKGFEAIYEQVFDWVEKKKIKMAFNPGTRQMKEIKDWRWVLKHTYILFVNKNEAKIILGQEEQHMKKLLAGVAKMGPKIVVITEGPQGSNAYDGKDIWRIGIIREAPAVERTGAGDSFACGVVSAVLKGKDLGEALRWGTANAASVIGKVGTQPGLLTEAGMSEWLQRYGKIRAKLV
jgi:sugar/nucleoside kinase (ribokinase family)